MKNALIFNTLAAMLLTSSAHALPPQHGGPIGAVPGFILEQLSLSSDQQSSIDSINNSYLAQIQEAQEALHASRLVLDNLVRTGSTDETAIRTAASNVGTKTGDLEVLRAAEFAAIRTVLTAEQITILDKLGSQDLRPHREMMR